MIGRRGLLGLLVGASALALSGCGSADDVYRYKMTVEVETPAGVKTGYAVRELKYQGRSSFPLGESRPGIRLKGEAVLVDIAPGKVLCALLTGADGESDYAARLADRIIVDPKTGLGWDRTTRIIEIWPDEPKTKGLARTSPLPMLVTFDSGVDPKSVRRVDPANLAEAFGPEVRLQRITVEVTDGEVTSGIGARLRWLGEYPEPSLNPDHGPRDFSLSATLHQGSFRQGTN